jgi:hypothetical protein
MKSYDDCTRQPTTLHSAVAVCFAEIQVFRYFNQPFSCSGACFLARPPHPSFLSITLCGIILLALPKEHLIDDLPFPRVPYPSLSSLGARPVGLDGPPSEPRDGTDAPHDPSGAVTAPRFVRQGHSTRGADVFGCGGGGGGLIGLGGGGWVESE